MSAIFSSPSCKGFCTMAFMKGLSSMPMVSFILHSASPVGTICIHRLKGSGEVVVPNLMHI